MRKGGGRFKGGGNGGIDGPAVIASMIRAVQHSSNIDSGTDDSNYSVYSMVEKVRQLLWHTNLSILEIALMTGFPSPSHLSRLYQTEFGLKPSEDRKDRTAL